MRKTIMRYICTLCFLFCLAAFAFAQEGNVILPEVNSKFSVSYAYLKQYEGVYEYTNNSTIKIAASPKDTALYALINESRYKLTAVEKDLFRDMTQNNVQFLREGRNKVTGFYSGGNTFSRLSSKLRLPDEFWYPRITRSTVYTYQQPESIRDGLPTGGLKNTGLDESLLTELMNKVIAGRYPNVHSILIIKDGKLVFEEYFYEHNRSKLHELRSASKSFVSALTGIAIDQGFIKSKEEKVLGFFPEYALANNSNGKKEITIENLLTNQSGLDCDVSNPNSVGNETVMNNTDDWVKFTLDLPMIDVPGGKGMYCSGNPITLGRIIEKSTKIPLPEFARKNLFNPLGIRKYVWNFKPDKSSSETFCQVYLTSRDMAKFGLLYLNKGEWHGKQVISTRWVEQSFQKHSVVQGVDYGYLWWNKYLDAGDTRYYAFGAQGNGGQKIYVWPELNMVTVITGGNYNVQSPSDELIKTYILPAFNKKN